MYFSFSELIYVCSTGWFVILLPYLELRLSLIISNPKFVRPLKIATIGDHQKYIDQPSEEIVIVWMTQRSLDCPTFRRQQLSHCLSSLRMLYSDFPFDPTSEVIYGIPG